MTLHRADTYRRRFERYLRYGTSIDLPLERKDDPSTERYVWRSRRDEKVRPAHRANDGHIFSWSTPPETGHPGTEPNCRCVAVPYREGETEFAEHTFTAGLASSYGRWEDSDFVWHFFTGGGRTVMLDEIGHLREIAEHHAYGTGNEGAFRRLSDQIADAARDSTSGSVHHDFNNTYDFGDVAFSHGNSTVFGAFDGTAERRGDMISIAGETNFNFRDVFTDPIDLRDFAAWLSSNPLKWGYFLRLAYTIAKIKILPSEITTPDKIEDATKILNILTDIGGTRYEIVGRWTASFRADIFANRAISAYFDPNRR